MEGTIRLNKYLSDAGICSRREADRLVEDGKVFVDGEVAVMGMQIHPGQKVVCDGKMVSEKEKPVFLIVNKPRRDRLHDIGQGPCGEYRGIPELSAENLPGGTSG